MENAMKFNINHEVKVRLTNVGRNVLKKQDEDMKKKYDFKKFHSMPQEDEEGWSTWQLWNLMQTFGSELYNGCQVPFETTIEISENN